MRTILKRTESSERLKMTFSIAVCEGILGVLCSVRSFASMTPASREVWKEQEGVECMLLEENARQGKKITGPWC